MLELSGEAVLIGLGLLASALVVGYVIGRTAAAPRARAEGLAELWRYHRLLQDAAREVGSLSGPGAAVAPTTWDDVLAARAAAAPFATRLPIASRWVLEESALPDVADPRLDLVDVAFAYVRIAEEIRGQLERRGVPPGVQGSPGGARRRLRRVLRR